MFAGLIVQYSNKKISDLYLRIEISIIKDNDNNNFSIFSDM